MFIDTHAHLYSEYYSNIEDIISRSSFCDIKFIINAGVDHQTNLEVLNLSSKYSDMFITLGIHPESCHQYQTSDLEFMEKNLSNPKVVAIGEIGLDYHYEGIDAEAQKILFEKQLALAEKYSLPVVVHSREATQDTLNILKKYSLKGIIHSFSGSKEVAQEYIKMGYKLGINGVVTFKNAHIKEVIKELGLDNFVLETDSPYLTPVPLRGQTNFPGNIKYIVAFLEEYLHLSSEDISKITNANVFAIFDKFTY